MGTQYERVPFRSARRRPTAVAMAIAALPLIALPAHAQEWMHQFGSESEDRAEAAMADGSGGVLFTGDTYGDLAGPNFGSHDVILGRYDGNGNQLWLVQFGTKGSDQGRDLTTDGAGGLFVTGRTDADFGGPNAGETDIFLAHFSLDGTQLWVRQFGSSGADTPLSMAADNNGGVFIGGKTYGDLGGVHQGGSVDAFIAHLDNDGRVLWIRQLGTSGSDYITEVVSDGAGGAFVAGNTNGVLAPSNGLQNDAFLARYDSQGNQLWIRQFGTRQSEKATAMMPDGAGGVILGGTTNGLLAAQNAGGRDIFLTQFTAEGEQAWIRQLGTTWNDVITSIVSDGAGGIIIGGYEELWGDVNAILASYDPSGVKIWFRRLRTAGGCRSCVIKAAFTMDIAEAGVGMAFAAILTRGSLAGPHLGSGDIVIARVGEPSCYPDCDPSTGVGVLDMVDFLCFQSRFFAGDLYACDCDTSTGNSVCDIFDFLCFQNAFVAGCP